MSFEIIREARPSYSLAAMAAIVVVAVLLLGMGAAFAWLLLTGTGSNYVLGTLLAFEFLAAGIEVVLFARYFIAFREVSEDREEELLW
jgi:hypothetical protein